MQFKDCLKGEYSCSWRWNAEEKACEQFEDIVPAVACAAAKKGIIWVIASSESRDYSAPFLRNEIVHI